MFEDLIGNESLESGSVTNTTATHKKKQTARALHGAMKLVRQLAKMRSDVQTMNKITCDYSDIRRAARVMKTTGLTKGLVLLMNPGGKVAMFKQLPAVESIDMAGIRPRDMRVRKSVEELEEIADTEQEKVASYLDKVGEDFTTVFQQLEEHLNEVEPLVTQAKDGLDSVTEEDLNQDVNTIAADALKAQLNTLVEVLKEIDVPVVDPTDVDAVNGIVKHVAELTEKITAFTGASVSEMEIIVNDDGVEEEHEPKASTLAELGYTVEVLKEVFELVLTLISELRALIARKNEILEHVKAVAEFVKTVDNEVPPATSDAIPEDSTTGGEEQPEPATEDDEETPPAEGGENGSDTPEAAPETTEEEPEPEATSVEEAPGVTTQVDVAYSIASSYVSLASLIIESSLDAIAAVQVIAEAVETDEEETPEGETTEEEPKPDEGEGSDNKTEGEGEDTSDFDAL